MRGFGLRTTALAAVLIVAAAGSRAKESAPTFGEDVAPIFNQHCVICHSPGEVAPMSLRTFEEARPWAKSIRRAVAEREMPPWHADPAFGRWANDMSLPEADIETIKRWVDAGAPAGELTAAPPPSAAEGEWLLGPPDLILELPATTVGPGGEDILLDHVVKADIPRDKWLAGVEFLPGDRRVVHHITGYVGYAAMNGPTGGAAAWSPSVKVFVIWAGGQPPMAYPEGVGHKLTRRQTFTFNMHYHPLPDAETTDVTRVGLHFGKGDLLRATYNVSAVNQSILIPPGESNYERRSFYQFAADSQIVSLFPHMHYRGRDMRYDLVRPDGSRETLLNVPRYDFNWQRVYYPVEPIDAPKGSRLEMTAHFDNSADNPLNPDPTAWIRTGEQTNDEMGIAFFDFVSADSVEPEPIDPPAYLAEVIRDHPAEECWILNFGRGALPAGAAIHLPREGGEGIFYFNVGFNLFLMDLREVVWDGPKFTFEMLMGDSIDGVGEITSDGTMKLDFVFSEEAQNDPEMAFGIRMFSNLEGTHPERAG